MQRIRRKASIYAAFSYVIRSRALSIGWITLPSSGRAFGTPLKSNVRPHTMPKFTLAAVIAFIIFSVQQACAQQPSAEATSIAREVLSRSSWLAEANRCPLQVMPEREAFDHLARNDCRSGQLSSCLSKCTAGAAGACYWLGHGLHQDGADQQAAEVLYQRSCKLGVMSGCTNRAAGMLSEKREDQSVQACAAATFSKVCALDDPWACTMYAMHLSRGLGIEQEVVSQRMV